MKKLLLAVASLATLSAHAADWRPLAKDETYIYYADTETTTRDGNLARIWVLGAYIAEPKRKIFRVLQEFNCANGEWRALRFDQYQSVKGKDVPATMIDKASAQHYLEPDSKDVSAFNFACSKRTVVDKILNWF